MIDLTSPMPGVVWHKPAPDAEPFCRPGDPVTAGQQVAVLEVMKMLAPIEAEADGVFAGYTLADGATVNAGDTIATLEDS